MGITWDLVGRVLITAPFVLVLAGKSVGCLFDVIDAYRWYTKLGWALAAVVMALIAVGIVVFITLDDDSVWCFKAHRGDPRCTQVGGG